MFTTLAHAASYGPGPFWFFPIFWFLVIGLLIFTFKRRRWRTKVRPVQKGCCANASPPGRSTTPSTGSVWKSYAPRSNP